MKYIKFLYILIYFAIVGFALNPQNSDTSKKSDDLLTKQLEEINIFIKDKSSEEKVYIFVGSAQHSQSTAFINDVLLTNQKLISINPAFKSIILSNEIKWKTLQYPFATVDNLNRIFEFLSKVSNKHKLVLFFLISTHGNVGLLSVNIDYSYYQPVKSVNLTKWLNSLSENSMKTVVLSSCYSGSFIEPLSHTNSIILTASAKDRNSFGCHPMDKNTYFIQELFNPNFDMNADWIANFSNTEKSIVMLEKKERQSPPSNPQIFVPENLKNTAIYNLLN